MTCATFVYSYKEPAMHGRPPLLSLEYFVATAQEGTVRAAAERLHVTPSAVSHQIVRLEEFLNTHLFNRYKRRLILTDSGKQYLEQVQISLDRIGYATRDIATRSKRRRLAVSLPPTFLAFWLLPRLGSLMAKYPDLDLRFIDSLTIDLTREDIDCGIEYCLTPNVLLESELLFNDEVVPLASSEYIKEHRIKTLEDVRRCTLIETEKRPWSWNNVLRNYPWRSECRTLTMQFTYQALTSVTLNQGIALANRHNADYLIHQGRLRMPFQLEDMRAEGPAYYFSCTPENAASPAVQTFRNWIYAQSRKFRRAAKPSPRQMLAK